MHALQRVEFADAQPAREHQFEHRALAQAERRLDVGAASEASTCAADLTDAADRERLIQALLVFRGVVAAQRQRCGPTEPR